MLLPDGSCCCLIFITFRCTEVAMCPNAGITSRCPNIVQVQPARMSETDFKNTSVSLVFVKALFYIWKITSYSAEE
jgi:hypothetical protein